MSECSIISIQNTEASLIILQKRKDSSDDTNISRKQLKKQKVFERKSSQSNHYDDLIRIKRLWESARLKISDITFEQRQKKVDEILKILQGKLINLCRKHDASRIVQTCLKYGSETHRQQIHLEMTDHYIDLSKTRYGSFLVSKALKYCSKQRNDIIKQFSGKVCNLITHQEGSYIIETIYVDYANSKQKAALVEEFFGPQYSLFKSVETASLASIYKNNPERLPSVLKHIEEKLQIVIKKGTLKHSIVHNVLWEYCQYASESKITEILGTIKEQVVEILHTKKGAEVAMKCIIYSNAKDRKCIIKSLSQFVLKIAKEEFGCYVLACIFECVDDTVLVQDKILKKLSQNLNELATDKYGQKVLIYILSAQSQRKVMPHVFQFLESHRQILTNTCKKEDSLRRQELLSFMVPLLSKNCIDHGKDWIVHPYAWEVLVYILLQPSIDADLLKHIANFVIPEIQPVTIDNPLNTFHKSSFSDTLKENFYSNKAFKSLIKANKEFAIFLNEAFDKENLLEWATSKASFVILNLLESSAISETMKTNLFSHLSRLQAIENNPGTSLICKKLQNVAN